MKTCLVHLSIGCLFVLTLMANPMCAQQQLYSNQSAWLYALENSAAIAVEPHTNLQALYRRNWTRADLSPQLFLCRLETGDKKIGGDAKIQQYTNQFYKQIDVKAGFRYNAKIDEHQALAFGMRFGFLQTSYNLSTLNPQHPEESMLQNNVQQTFSPVADFGCFYNFKNFKAGISATNINLFEAKYYPSTLVAELPNFLFFSSVSFKFSNYSIAPLCTIRSSLGLPATADLGVLLEKKSTLGLQIGYKTNSVIYANLRCFIGAQLALSYSYDYPLSTVNYLGTGNELSLQFTVK